MLSAIKLDSSSSRAGFQFRRYQPAQTITNEPKHFMVRQHTFQDLTNLKISGYSPTHTQNLFVRKQYIKPSLKLEKIKDFTFQDDESSFKGRTNSLQNSKKVDFHPSVLVIYSEKGIKKREKLVDEPQIIRRGARRNCILIQKK